MSAEGPADGTVKKSVFRRAVKVPAQGLVQGHDTLVAAPNKQLVLPLPAPMQSAPAAQPQTKTSVPKKGLASLTFMLSVTPLTTAPNRCPYDDVHHHHPPPPPHDND
eukprot:167572-Rhodomonas_salina.1